MRIAISNIAWQISEDSSVLSLLQSSGVDAIDVAPSKYFPDVHQATVKEVHSVRDWWASHGIEIWAMQSLMFGTNGLNVFGTIESREAMLDHLESICRIGSLLGVRSVVFGSPKNRDRSGRTDEETTDIAISFFRRFGDIADRYGLTVCLEPNPSRYGANFMLTTAETANIALAIDHQAIKMQLDTGAIAINADNIEQTLQQYAPYVGHVHASEPDLITLGEGGVDHFAVSSALRRYLPSHVVSIEMLPVKQGSNLNAIERALSLAVKLYA